MKYLLDTHALLWSLFESTKLSKSASSIISDIGNDIFVSTISLWEISLKYSLGKMSLYNIFPDQLPTYVIKSGYKIITVDEIITSSFYKLPKYGHADPFDRLLIWQAINLEYILISKDSQFEQYSSVGLVKEW